MTTIHAASFRPSRVKLVSLFLALLAASAAVVSADDRARIVVEGSGELTVEPDLAVLTVAVDTAQESANAATQENARKMAAVIEAVESSYGDAGKLSTGSFSLQPHYGERRPGSNQPPSIVGYIASNQIRIEIRQLDKIGAVLDAALAAGANRSSGLSFLREDRSEESVVLALAASDAANRARVLAEALGVKLVRVLEARNGSAGVDPRPVFYAERAMMNSSESPGTQIEAGDITLRATVQVIWEIE